MHVVPSQSFTMHYCSKDSWIFHRNNCSAHTDDWHTYSQTEQRCSQRARKSRLRPLRAAAHKQRYFSCLWLPLTCCLSVVVFDCDDSVCEVGSCVELGRFNRFPLIFEPLNYCSTWSYKGAIDRGWSFLERVHPPHTRFKSLTLKLVVSFWLLSVQLSPLSVEFLSLLNESHAAQRKMSFLLVLFNYWGKVYKYIFYILLLQRKFPRRQNKYNWSSNSRSFHPPGS